MAVVRQLRKDDVISTGGRLEALGLKCPFGGGRAALGVLQEWTECPAEDAFTGHDPAVTTYGRLICDGN